MGTYLSTTKPAEETHPVYPPRTPVGDVFRAILEQNDESFEVILAPFIVESPTIVVAEDGELQPDVLRNGEPRNEEGETPLEYLLSLGLTQRRFNILSLLLKHRCCAPLLEEDNYKLLTPLLWTKSMYAPVYIARLLPYIENIPPDLVLETTSEAVHRLFCEYGLSHRIRYVDDRESQCEEND